MAGELILDTGPLVAFPDAYDSGHDVCTDFISACRRPLVTTDAVVAEAMHLLRRAPGGQQVCLSLLIEGFASVCPISVQSLRRIRTLMDRYADLPMDYADATLVVLAEDLGVSDILTLDRRDFGVYRIAGTGAFHILP